MAVKGIFVSDAGALAERPEALSSTILREGRGAGVPLFALSSGMETEECDQTMVSWYEEGIMHSRTIVQAISNPNANTFVVEDSSWITENSVFIAENTGEYMIVLAVTGNAVTMQRGIAGTGNQDIILGAGEFGIQMIGTAFEEGSERPTAVATSPYPRNNITQIFRNAWDITGTAQATTYRFGSRLSKNKGTAGLRHALDMERSLLWGKLHNGVVNNKPHRQMNGMLAQLRSNFFVSPVAGLTRRALGDYVERLFSKNIEGMPNERLTFCGNVAVRALNEIAWRYGDYSIQEVDNSFGLKVSKFTTPFGDLTMLIHPLMNENPLWSSQLYSLHPGAMKMCWLRRTTHETEGTNGSASDLRDAKAGVFTSEMTCKYAVEQTGGVLTDIKVDHYVKA